MAPCQSKQHARPSRGPSDAVFLAATKGVRPAVDGLLATLRESIEGLHAAAAARCSGASEAAVRATGDALRRAADVLCCCETAVRGFFRGKWRPLSEPLPIAFVFWILGLLYCAYVFAYLPAAGLALNSPASIAFHALFFLILTSFTRAAATDPGGVPNSPAWRTQGEPPPGVRERKRGTGEARWCRREECYKPDRAHRSSALGRTVLRMDHHCMWLGNTVGFRNHKFFLLFLLYANAACGYFGCSVLELLLRVTLPPLSSFLLTGASGLVLVLLAVIGPFLLFHTWLLFRNSTTIEFMEGFRSQASAPAASQATKATEDAAAASGGSREEGTEAPSDKHAAAGSSPYDLGWYRNVCSVLGDNPLVWFLPVSGPSGDGLSYPCLGEERPEEGLGETRAAVEGEAGAKEDDVGSWLARLRSPLRLTALKDEDEPGSKGEALLGQDQGGNGQGPEDEPDPEPGEPPGRGAGGTAAEEGTPAALVASRAAAETEEGWAWTSASAFVADLSLGFRCLGEALEDAAEATSKHVCALGLMGGAAPERKARRGSWQRIARQSFEAAASPTPKGLESELLCQEDA